MYRDMLAAGKEHFTDSEAKILGRILPYSFARSAVTFDHPQTIADFGMNVSDMAVKFDFTVANPGQPLEKFLKGRADRFNDWCEKGSCQQFLYDGSTQGLEGAYELRNHIHGVFATLCDMVTDEYPIEKQWTRTTNIAERSKQMHDSSLFERVSNGLLCMFPKGTSLLSYGSFVNPNPDRTPSDIDFKAVLPRKMSVDHYANYMVCAGYFSQGWLPDDDNCGIEVTYAPLTKEEKDRLMLFSTNNTFADENSVVIGDLDVFASPIADQLHLIYAMQRFVKARKALRGENFCHIPAVLPARRNDPYHMKIALDRLFGDREVAVQKFGLVAGSTQEQIDDCLIQVNEDMARILAAYPEVKDTNIIL